MKIFKNIVLFIAICFISNFAMTADEGNTSAWQAEVRYVEDGKASPKGCLSLFVSRPDLKGDEIVMIKFHNDRGAETYAFDTPLREECLGAKEFCHLCLGNSAGNAWCRACGLGCCVGHAKPKLIMKVAEKGHLCDRCVRDLKRAHAIPTHESFLEKGIFCDDLERFWLARSIRIPDGAQAIVEMYRMMNGQKRLVAKVEVDLQRDSRGVYFSRTTQQGQTLLDAWNGKVLMKVLIDGRLFILNAQPDFQSEGIAEQIELLSEEVSAEHLRALPQNAPEAAAEDS